MTKLDYEKTDSKAKWMILIVYLLIIGNLALGFYLLYVYFFPSKDICLTEACLESSVDLTSSINSSADPCDDFQQFICGNFKAKAYAESSPAVYYLLNKKRNTQQDALITEPITGEEWGPLLLQKQYYQACTNLSAIDSNGKEILMNLIELLGGWPVLDGQNWQEVDISDLILQSKVLGLPYHMFFQIMLDSSNGKLRLHIPVYGLEKLEDTFTEAVYLNLMIETAVLLGAPITMAKIEMEKSLQFHKQLLKISRKIDGDVRALNQRQLNEIFPYFDMDSLVKNLTEDDSFNDTVIFADVGYLSDLNLLFSGTSKRTLANTFIWRIINSFGLHLPSEIRTNFEKFSNFMSRQTKLINMRNDLCLTQVKSSFPLVADVAYLKVYEDEQREGNAKIMLKYIKNALMLQIEKADWIEEGTKELAFKKLENVIGIIGHRDLEFGDQMLENFLHILNFNFTSDNIIDMIREKNINDFYVQLHLNEFGDGDGDVINRVLIEHLVVVNALYVERFNILAVSTPMLDDYFNSLQRPNYLNFGKLGVVMAHELAHGFYLKAFTHESQKEHDIMHQWFNISSITDLSKIYPMNTDLWRNNTLAELEAKVACINELADKNDEENYLEENFADFVGIEVAYESYLQWLSDNQEEAGLPNLPYTPTQLFWMQFASQFCFQQLDNMYDWKRMKVEGNHAPFKYRILLPLKHSKHFARDFQCQLGSYMNPVKKCTVF